jgi:predicted regulator of Ras-like GTPase activity (Roadblock/LC7/MglB family)
MPFIDILNEIINKVPKALGLIIIDYEGEAVQLAAKMDEHDLKIIGAYQVIHFNNLDEKYGTAATFITKADSLDIISMRLDDDYFISLVLEKGAVLGRSEFVLKNSLDKIKAIM